MYIKFEEFKNFASESQKRMRNNKFCDVTLASADNQKFQAHKVILVAYSSVFKNMLENEEHPHPIMFIRGVGNEALEALLGFIYLGEVRLEEENLAPFLQLISDIELLGVTTEVLKKEISLVKDKQGKTSKPCKHWNKGFCKNKYCEFMHSKDDCQFHIDGGNCQDKNCPKRHRNTCRDWYNDGCGRKQRCAYLHKETYDSKRTYYSESRSIGNHRNGNRTVEREGSKNSKERSYSRGDSRGGSRERSGTRRESDSNQYSRESNGSRNEGERRKKQELL